MVAILRGFGNRGYLYSYLAYRTYDRDFKQISQIIQTKTETQLRSHHQKWLLKEAKKLADANIVVRK
jgi:predicted nucleotidyltransferase